MGSAHALTPLRPMVVAGWTAVPLVDLAMLKLLGSCLLIFASGVFAQTPDTATIQGQVTDPSRAATAGINLQLSVSGGQTQITVTGTVGEVRTDAPQIGTRLGAQQMEETPLLSRRISNLPMLNAANRPAISQGDVFMNQTLF